jgi:hypothetical protein
MVKTYALRAPNGNFLALPVMTLKDAESCRDTLAKLGRIVYVTNIATE